MTTCEPGAIEVLTHGLTASPLSTALRASSAAPSITEGFDVLVHEVIEAITTAPWSISNSAPFSETAVGLLVRPPAPAAAETAGRGAPSPLLWFAGAAGSLAGKLSSPASSTEDRESWA